MYLCIFWGPLESIYPVELRWNFDLYTLGHGKCGILQRSGFCCTFRDRIGWLVELWNHVCIWRVYDYVAGKPLNFRIQSTLPALDRNSWNTSPKGRGSALIQTINVLVLSVSPCQVFGSGVWVVLKFPYSRVVVTWATGKTKHLVGLCKGWKTLRFFLLGIVNYGEFTQFQ